MPLSRLQKRGGAQECRWHATSARDGREDRGSVSSLLAVAAVVPCSFFDLSHAETSATQSAASARAAESLRMPCICER